MMKSILVPAGLVLLAACGGGGIERPFFTEPPSFVLPTGARSDRNLVAVCYSSATTSAEALRTLVARACESPQLLRQDLTGGCTLVQPVRATFACSRIDREVARVEVPYIKGGDEGRFRLDPEVPGDESRELVR
ncbi:hypothetical protein [Desertibaculum subflavum]|uniref:hypothetical protein n=1 Tax=Desertibaculum subflavum TaxID=2268458 RepID=UPI0013C407E7